MEVVDTRVKVRGCRREFRVWVWVLGVCGDECTGEGWWKCGRWVLVYGDEVL